MAAELWVRVTPRAAVDRVGPWADGVLAVRVRRPPLDGEANAAVCRLVADALGVSSGAVRVVVGERSKRKRLSVEGIGSEDLARRLARLPG